VMRVRPSRRPLVLIVAGLSLMVGCAAPQAGPPSAASLRIASPDADAVYAVALDVLRGEFATIRRSPTERRADAAPIEFTAREGSGTARDLYGGASRLRRSAWLLVEPRRDHSRAWLRIDIEREDTARRDALRPTAGRLSDRPGDTPIEQDAATTTAQNTIWTAVGRDRALERALLTAISEQFAGPAATASEAPTVPAPDEAEPPAADPGESRSLQEF
jgi:hypothetical protein